MIEKRVIVVVDDNPVVHTQFQRAIEAIDAVDLLCYSSKKGAMAYLCEHKPQLLFLDTLIQDEEGIVFLQRLRQNPLHQSTFTIMLTSQLYAQDEELTISLGVLDFLIKPMSAKKIRDIILRYIDKDNPY